MHHMHIAAILPVCIPIISAVSINVWMFDSIYLVLTYIQIANIYLISYQLLLYLESYYKILGTKIKIHNDFDSKSILLQKGFFSPFLKTKTLKEAL